MKKTVLAAAIIIILLTSALQAHAAPPYIDARSCVLIESQTGQVLYEQNKDGPKVYPASTTKIITAIIALERGNLNQLMVASEEAVYDIGKDGMNIGIMAGEEVPMINLLEAMLISSANETANIIAENICETRQEFIDLMNEKAAEIGAINTHFTNTCGMHDNNHYTTAYDLAIIAKYAMSMPKFREIVAKSEFSMPATNKHDTWPTLGSTNKLLKWPPDCDIDGFKVLGIKTGYTDPAGHNLVSSAVDKSGMELISVILGVTNPGAKDNIYKYSMNLLEYGFKNFTSKYIVKEGQVVFSDIPVTDSEGTPGLDLLAQESIFAVLPMDNPQKEDTVSKKEYIKSPVIAPVNRGDVLGYVEFWNNGIMLGKTNVVASIQINKTPEKLTGDFSGLIGNPVLKRSITVAIALLSGFFLLRLTLRTISRRRIRYKKYRYYR